MCMTPEDSVIPLFLLQLQNKGPLSFYLSELRSSEGVFVIVFLSPCSSSKCYKLILRNYIAAPEVTLICKMLPTHH